MASNRPFDMPSCTLITLTEDRKAQRRIERIIDSRLETLRDELRDELRHDLQLFLKDQFRSWEKEMAIKDMCVDALDLIPLVGKHLKVGLRFVDLMKTL